jgi:hypothetical protein
MSYNFGQNLSIKNFLSQGVDRLKYTNIELSILTNILSQNRENLSMFSIHIDDGSIYIDAIVYMSEFMFINKVVAIISDLDDYGFSAKMCYSEDRLRVKVSK